MENEIKAADSERAQTEQAQAQAGADLLVDGDLGDRPAWVARSVRRGRL